MPLPDSLPLIENTRMCFDCPHNPMGQAILSKEEVEDLWSLAEQGFRHECHNNRDLLCIGSRIGPWASIREAQNVG